MNDEQFTCNRLAVKERADCFTLIVFFLTFGCLGFVPLPRVLFVSVNTVFTTIYQNE